MALQYMFFKTVDTMSAEIRQLIHNSVDRITDVSYYTIVDGVELPLLKDPAGNFIIKNLNKYIQEKGLIISEAKQKLLLEKMNANIRPYTRENLYQRYFDPRIPSDYLKFPGVWVSYMIDSRRQKIIGIYHGKIDTDSSGRRYNRYSAITIHPNYTGKGLCRPFAKFTYSMVFKEWNISYMNIHIDSFTPYAACRCYIAAALSLKLTPYLSPVATDDFKLISNRDNCDIYQTDGDAKLIITNNIDIDTDMIDTYNDY